MMQGLEFLGVLYYFQPNGIIVKTTTQPGGDMSTDENRTVHTEKLRNEQDAQTFKIVGFALAFAGKSIPGLIFSIIAFRQLKRLGQPTALATAGIWINSIFTLLGIIYFIGFGYFFLTHAKFSE